MIFNKKGISPVVSTALLIVVAVVAVIGFSTWFGSYQSGVNSDLETKTSSSSIGGTGIVGVYNNMLYFRNSGPNVIGFTNIKITGTDCVYSGSAQPNSIAQIPFDNCSSNLKGIYEIVAESNDKIYSKKIYLKGVEVLSGVLADSPVQGVEYNTTSGLSGITDANGIFKYNSGDSVTFILGNYTFSSFGERYITPLEVFGTSNIDDLQVINMVRLFLALDSDSNPDNGISIDSTKASAITPSLNFNQNLSDFDNSLPSEINTSVINETFAIEHFNKTLKLISGDIEEELGLNLNQNWVSTINISDLFNDNSSLLLYSFDDSLNDSTNTHNGIWSGDINYTIGRFGKSIRLNGVDSYVYNIGTNNWSSISIWFKTNDNSTNELFGESNSTYYNYAVLTEEYIRYYSESLGSINVFNGSSFIEYGIWHNIIFQRENNENYIYLDGEDISGHNSYTTNDITQTNIIYNLGIRKKNPNYREVEFDQIRVFNRALTSEEISIIYNEGYYE